MARKALEYPLPFRILRTLFPVVERLVPSFAQAIAVRLFLTPIKFGMTAQQRLAISKYEKRLIRVKNRAVMVYERGEGPIIVGLHGWSGRAMQFWVLGDALVAAGYTCVFIDAPAHGESPGKRSNLFEFAETLDAVLNIQENRVLAVMGHSLGAAATSYAISTGVDVPAMITLGAPVVAKDILSDFCRRLNGSSAISESIQAKAVSEFGLTFVEVTMETTFKSVYCPVIGFHGLEDQDVPVYHLDVLSSIRPDMEAHKLTGIGHRRVLKDDRVIEHILAWLRRLDQPKAET